MAKKYSVLLYHNCANAYRTFILAENEDEAGEKAIKLWEADGGAQFDRSDDEDYQGDLNVQDCEEVSDGPSSD